MIENEIEAARVRRDERRKRDPRRLADLIFLAGLAIDQLAKIGARPAPPDDDGPDAA